MADKQTKISWTLSILLALPMIGAGAGKFTGAMDAQLTGLGVPTWAIPVIGGLEILGATLIAVPKTRFWGAKLLATLMIGAVGTHLINGDFAGAPPSLVLGILAGIVGWIERPAWTEKWFPRSVPA